MKIVLCGQRTFGALVLQMLLERGDEVALVSAPLLHKGGGRDALMNTAVNLRLPAMEAGSIRAEHIPPNTDLIIAAHSHDFLGAKTRLAAKLGAIGYHPSLLPRHRGRDAVRWAVKVGDPVTGGSVYWLDGNVDGGPIAKQDWCWIRRGDTARELWRRDLQRMGVRLLRETLEDLDRGVIVAIDQDEALATWEPSWEREPIFRPELPQIGAVSGYTVVKHDPYRTGNGAAL